MSQSIALPTDVLGIHNRLGKDRVDREMKEYYNLFNNDMQNDSKEAIEKRKENYGVLVKNFYDLVTDFYEYLVKRISNIICLHTRDMDGENPSTSLQDTS
jgi:hypothetical protein